MNGLPLPLQQIDGTWVLWKGRRLSYFGGCDYFRLSIHPRIHRAIQSALRAGLNVAASRITTGNHELYEKLERSLADYFGADCTALVSTGYVAPVVAAQALAGEFSHALVDEGNHPCLTDATQFLGAAVVPFRHRDPADLGRQIARLRKARRLILLTDGLFSRDGTVAPLAEYRRCLPRTAWMLVDDAHAAGVIGKHGRGSIEEARIDRSRLVQTVTLSKAFGTYGGAVLCDPRIHRKILQRSRLFTGSTPLPLPLAAAAIEALGLVRNGVRRRKCHQNTDRVRERLRQSGVASLETPGPIISITPRNQRETTELQRHLLRAGILPPLIRYPTGSSEGYFRFAVSSEHTTQQLDALADALVAWQQR